MENLCRTCKRYNKNVDELRSAYDDNIYEKDNRQKHGCIMYNDYIPQKIWYNNADCPFYEGVKNDDFFEDVRNLANQIRKKEKEDVNPVHESQRRSDRG